MNKVPSITKLLLHNLVGYTVEQVGQADEWCWINATIESNETFTIVFHTNQEFYGKYKNCSPDKDYRHIIRIILFSMHP